MKLVGRSALPAYQVIGFLGLFIAPEGSVFVATMPAMTNVIGPVGPEICTGVPPKTAATMPVAMAP